MIIPLNVVVFALLTCLFGFLAIRASRNLHSPADYFHNDNLKANVLSLTAANITLGSGLAYLIQGGSQNGVLMFLVPLAVWTGYVLLARFITHVVSPDLTHGRNFLAAVDETISAETGVPSRFGILVSGCLILVYVLYLAFEVFASAQIAVPILFGRSDSLSTSIFSFVVFIVALIYAVVGGLTTVFRTDKVQLALILIFVSITVVVNLQHFRIWPNANGEPFTTFQFDAAKFLAVATACIAALATQFYSILNWTTVSHVQRESQGKVLQQVGLLTGIILLVIVAIGVFYPTSAGENVVAQVMLSFSAANSNQSAAIYIVAPIAVAGIASMLFSTIDSLIIAITQFFYDNVLGRDSKVSQTGDLKPIRTIAFVCFLLSFIVLALFNYFQPNIFFLLLSIASGTIIFAPAIATAGFLSREPGRLRVWTTRVVYGYVLLFIAAFIANALAFVLKPSLAAWLGVVGFLISVSYSMILIRFSRVSD